MRCVTGLIGCWLALLLCGCAHRDLITTALDGVAAEFIGSTPGDGLARDFIGGLASNAPCHCIVWHLTLLTNQNAGLPSTFRLSAQYQVPTPSNPNRSEDGPSVALRGTWEFVKGARSRAEVYRLHAKHPDRALSFVKVNDHLLHLSNPDGSLAVGNGGWSYTLNDADQAEKPGDLAAALNATGISYKISPMATGPTVFGVFEGRTPCHGISRELKLPQHAGCIKAKWCVTLYQNPETLEPTTYKVEGSLFREGAREGTWRISHGAATDKNATVYQLNPTQTQPALLLMKADDNVLFFLDHNGTPLVGHGEFSYTLNRVAAK